MLDRLKGPKLLLNPPPKAIITPNKANKQSAKNIPNWLSLCYHSAYL